MDLSTAPAVAKVTRIAPQFLVDDLQRAIGYYRDALGFSVDFEYDGFYASVSRDGCAIHLKCAPKIEADRAHRREHTHLDAYIAVSDATVLHDELRARGARIVQALQDQPWWCRDFQVVDPDGYILCFSEPTG